MNYTVKQVARQEGISQQAIRAKIKRLGDFEDLYTTIKDGKRVINDKGVDILAKHRNKPHKHFTLSDKRVYDAKLKQLTEENRSLRYQLKNNDKTAVIQQLSKRVSDLKAYNTSLNKDKSRLNKKLDSSTYENRVLTYYKKTNWLERAAEHIFHINNGLKPQNQIRTVNVKPSDKIATDNKTDHNKDNK